jgi:hypothetical protein
MYAARLTALFLLLSGPLEATTFTPKDAAELTAAIQAAQPGDEIHLTPGTRYVGQFKLPPKAGTVVIRSAATLPNRRITPTDLPLLPVIASGVGAMALDLYDSRNWTIDGIAFEPNTNGAGEIIGIWRADAVTLDRLLLVVPSGGMQRRFVLGNGTRITLTRSHCQGVWINTGQDSQCFVAWDGAGPYTITDNYLQAASENVMFGGSDPSSVANIPSDILVEGNLFTKDLAWKGQPRGVKNLFELKAARRVIVRNNTFENNWADAQSGRSIVFTPRNQGGTAPWTVIEDVLFERNTVRDVSMGFNLLGYDNLAPSGQTSRIVIRDNAITTTAGMAILATSELGKVEIYRNTITVPAGVPYLYLSDESPIATATGSRPAAYAIQDFVWASNVTPAGYIGSPKQNGIAAFGIYTVTYSLVEPVDPPPPPPPPPPVLDTQPPVIHSVNIARSAGNTYRVATLATDDVGVFRVDVIVDGAHKAMLTAPTTSGDTYTAYVKVTGKGSTPVVVVVYDSRGNKAEQTRAVVR